MSYWTLGMNMSEQYQLDINLHVWRCPEDDGGVPAVAEPEEAQTESPAVLEAFLGSGVYTWLQTTAQTFQSAVLHPDSSDVPVVEPERCVLLQEYEYTYKICPVTVQYWISVALLVLLGGVCLCLVLIWLCYWTLKTRRQLLVEDSLPVMSSDTGAKQGDGVDSQIEEISAKTIETSELLSSPKSVEKCRNFEAIPLACQKDVKLSCKPLVVVRSLDTGTFLQNTTDRLFAEIDKLLLKEDGNVVVSPVMSCATPRLTRRVLQRRPRIGSSPNLPEAGSSLTSHPDPDVTAAWTELEDFSGRLGLKEPRCPALENNSGDRKLHRLTQFHMRVCPIVPNHWSTARLVVDHALLLMKKELDKVVLPNGYRFVEFSAIGSGKMGTKVSKPNQFDFCFVMQNGNLTPAEAADQYVNHRIPAGKLMLFVDERRGAAAKTSARSMNVNSEGNVQKMCLSSKEFYRSAEELVDTALKALYTKTRSLMDRLPFSLQRAATPNLLVTLDTRTLVGFGLQEIKIRLVPCFPLPVQGWVQPVQLYATAPWEVHEYKRSADNLESGQDPDFLWQIFCCDFDDFFLRNVELKMLTAGVQSCHLMCLQILKALLTVGSKKNLLDRGELQSFQLSTVMNYLLLESRPEQWSFEKLPDRFSDCIHFLRSAFQHGRLPHFFVSNPHLSEKMPCLQTWPMLCRGRQENILSEMRSESLGKCVQFMEDSLREAGLQDCLKEDFSDDMWEYEFFVFN